MTIPIERALADRKLLCAALGPLEPWKTWLAVLKAAFGESKLSDEERALFEAVAGGRPLPKHRVAELWAVIGRRAGKTQIAAAIGVYCGVFMPLPRKLAPGEVGEVTIIAASREQASVALGYMLGFLQSSPVLRQEIENITKTSIRLRGGILLSTRAGSYRTTRGRTLLAAIIDEVAFLRDESSAIPDVETYRALLPALATTGGMLVGISTPYRRIGLLYQKHRDYFGIDDADVLVVAGTSAQFNPLLDTTIIERARVSDPEAARGEWDAIFRSDLVSFLDDALIEHAIDTERPLELPPRPGLAYQAFVDASSGVIGGDHYVVAIGHKEADNLCVVDVVRGIEPPFDPRVATEHLAAWSSNTASPA